MKKIALHNLHIVPSFAAMLKHTPTEIVSITTLPRVQHLDDLTDTLQTSATPDLPGAVKTTAPSPLPG